MKRYLLLRDFGKRHVNRSPKKTERALSINSIIISKVEQHLKLLAICDRVEMIVSDYEDLIIDDANNIWLEAPMIIPICKSDIEVMKMGGKPDYVWLKCKHGAEPRPGFDRVLSYDRYLDSKETLALIYEELQKYISESKQMNGKVKLNCSGPVIRMEVYPNSWWLSWGSRLYTVDIVPAYKLGEELYESKPVESDEMPGPTIWHRSFALQERKKLCKGSKKILRVLRGLRDFGNFSSYQLKNVVFHEMDANQDWSEPVLRRRLADVLERLEKSLQARNLPNYFLPEINLLSNMPLSTIAYMCYRIQRLPACEIEIC